MGSGMLTVVVLEYANEQVNEEELFLIHSKNKNAESYML